MGGMKPLQQRVWTAAKHHRDVEIDWSVWRDVELIADVEMTGGSCRAGIWDVDNDALVSSGDSMQSRRVSSTATGEKWSESPAVPLPEEIAHATIPIPKQSGRKTYRLVVQPIDKGTTTFWISGAITFPILPMGGQKVWIAPTTLPRLRPAIEYRDVEIDWGKIRDPINSVIAEVLIGVSDPRTGDVGRGRVVVWNVTDNEAAVLGDWVDKHWHSYRNKPWAGGKIEFMRYPVREPLIVRLQLPTLRSGKKVYRLMMEVEELGTSIMVSGRLLLRH